MARIEEISVKNYRVLQNITLKDIKPFSVFLGLNGSGKTTFFDVIGFLSDCLTTNAIKTIGQLSDNPRIASLRRFIEGWFLSYFIPDQARQLATAGAMELRTKRSPTS